MSELEIREARPAEYAAVGELCVAAYGGAYGVSDEYAATLRDVAGRASDATVLVALDGGVPVGTVTLIARGGRSHEIAEPDEAEFRFLAVPPQAQRAGVAAALVRRCAAEATALGRTRLVCSSGAWMPAAHAFYARLGFDRVPERDWRPRPDLPLLVFSFTLAR